LIESFFFLLGAIFGSFFNVVIFRLPKAILADADGVSLSYGLDEFKRLFQVLVYPPSTTPCCHRRISWYHNLPLVSWLSLHGKCHFCGEGISSRYLLVELLSAICFLYLYLMIGLTWGLAFWCFFYGALICLFFIDLETFLLPDVVTLTLCGLALLAAVSGVLEISPLQSIAGGILGYVLPWAVDGLYFLIRKKRGFGGGDMKLLAAFGFATGVISMVISLFFASLIALLTLLFKYAIKRGNINLQKAFPFGPFLIISFVVIKHLNL
jgi:leader peptidase (prepilin peptidase)/N-methyltransferase